MANFNVLITSATDAPRDSMSVILPLLLLVAAVLGVAMALFLRSTRPAVFQQIGEGGAG